MFVLGIDPGLSTTGYGLVRSGHPPEAVAAGAIRTSTDQTMEQRLDVLFQGVTDVIREYRPDAMALETVFTNRNLQTAIAVGRASGVAMLAGAREGIAVSEYVPTAIKAAVTGDGGAGKAAVAMMVTKLLKLTSPPKPADAADALAIALCHLRSAPLMANRRR